jgi:hypothetical protein
MSLANDGRGADNAPLAESTDPADHRMVLEGRFE